jgi:hypothetical protein
MDNCELKNLLVETCPVRPGQEARAWTSFRERLYQPRPFPSPWERILSPSWRGFYAGGAMVCALLFICNSAVRYLEPVSFASANSEVPGVYATSFYSHSAQAQVVWLNGLEPASDQPTYLDPTTPIPHPVKSPRPSGDQGGL